MCCFPDCARVRFADGWCIERLIQHISWREARET
jgi:hypothetical protein